MIESDASFQHFDESFAALINGANAAESAQQGPWAAQLDKRGATLTPPARGEVKTIGRWRLKHSVSQILREVPEGASTPGVCKCGMSSRDRETVDLVLRSGRPGVAGVFFCDSPWLCPSCAPRRAGERVERLNRVFDAAERRKGTVVFVTLTVRHELGQSLADLKRLVQSACADARRGAPWERARKRFGIAGVVSSPEVTYGDRTGWHFHLHVALVLLPVEGEEKMSPVTMIDRGEKAGEWLVDRYMRYIKNAGGTCDRKAQDVQAMIRREDLASYVGKGSGAWEIAAAGATKLGKMGNSPWDLVARASRGDHVAAALFKEYAKVMPGTRSCVISANLAQTLGIEAEGDSDEPGIKEMGDDEEKVVELKTSKWNRILRRGCAPDVLNAVALEQSPDDILELVDRLLHETAVEDDGWTGNAEMSVSARQLAREARYIQDRRRSRTTSGAALQIALQQRRDKAARKGSSLILPDLKTTMSLMIDGIA